MKKMPFQNEPATDQLPIFSMQLPLPVIELKSKKKCCKKYKKGKKQCKKCPKLN